jgi:hypothetical protein
VAAPPKGATAASARRPATAPARRTEIRMQERNLLVSGLSGSSRAVPLPVRPYLACTLPCAVAAFG